MPETERTVTVADLMRRDVPVAALDDSIATVAKMLIDANLPGVAVVADGVLHGIITEGDLVFREADVSLPSVTVFFDAMLVADAGRPLADDLRRVLAVTAAQLMSAPVYTIRQEATLSQVATLMSERKVNPVPVVDNANHMVGMVSRTDLVRLIAGTEHVDDAAPATPGGDARG
ncbi:MAG: CBS domain-containing protein [Thermomicrobiales bacterium]|nr:CBS domain-containing protein [Thermomicrobiales bacterium]